MLLLLVQLLLTPASGHRHFPVHRNLKGLEPIQSEAFTHSFELNDQDNDISLDYEGQHHPDLLNLLTHQEVARVHCSSDDTTLTVTWTTPSTTFIGAGKHELVIHSQRSARTLQRPKWFTDKWNKCNNAVTNACASRVPN